MLGKASFYKSVVLLKDLPTDGKPEILLCGRSNVGKSSFINSIFSNKKLAKVGSSPGKTRSLNFYEIGEKFYIIDMPGYGYAQASKAEIEKWKKLIEGYFKLDRNVILVFHLLDARIAPTKLDVQMRNFANNFIDKYIAVINKIDKVNRAQLNKTIKRILSEFENLKEGENLFLHSTLNGTGKKEIIRIIKSLDK